MGTGSQCHTSFGCYCDEACIEYEDCCSDVPRRVNCQNTERGVIRIVSKAVIVHLCCFLLHAVLASQETRPNPVCNQWHTAVVDL